MPGLTVAQETNSNGHVDLTIEADHCTPARVKLGEARLLRWPELSHQRHWTIAGPLHYWSEDDAVAKLRAQRWY